MDDTEKAELGLRGVDPPLSTSELNPDPWPWKLEVMTPESRDDRLDGVTTDGGPLKLENPSGLFNDIVTDVSLVSGVVLYFFHFTSSVLHLITR